MNISFENPDKINGLLTMTLEKEDYQAEVEKTLKRYSKTANVPGFRPGHVPMGLIKRQYGTSVKVDVVNKMLSEKLPAYISENNIQMLGEPMPNTEKQPTLDFESDEPLTFVFDIAVQPEFKVELTGRDKIDYYTINVDDELINKEVEGHQNMLGKHVQVESYQPELKDMLKGDIHELDAEGNAKEDGIIVEGAVMMPQYFQGEDQKELFNGAVLGSLITFDPKKAYTNESEIASLLKIDKETVADVTSNFSFLVTEITRFEKGEVNQELFDAVFGEGEVKDEAEFRSKIAEQIKENLVSSSDYKFMIDVHEHMDQKIGKVEYPEALLKKMMLLNNKDKDEKFVDDNFDNAIKDLTWQLVKSKLAETNSIKIEKEDIIEQAKMTAQAQFAQYGMRSVPEEYMTTFVNNMLKDQNQVSRLADAATETKLAEALKKIVKLNEISISYDDFAKMLKGE